jgi:hypothetical protein
VADDDRPEDADEPVSGPDSTDSEGRGASGPADAEGPAAADGDALDPAGEDPSAEGDGDDPDPDDRQSPRRGGRRRAPASRSKVDAGAPRTALSPRVEAWRKRTATGAILTGFALALQNVFEPERKEPAIVMETSGDPPADLPVEAHLADSRPKRSVVNIRPWLLPGADAEAAAEANAESTGSDADPDRERSDSADDSRTDARAVASPEDGGDDPAGGDPANN